MASYKTINCRPAALAALKEIAIAWSARTGRRVTLLRCLDELLARALAYEVDRASTSEARRRMEALVDQLRDR